MEYFLQTLILVPLIGFLISGIPAQRNEKAIAGIAFFSVGLHFLVLLCFVLLWIILGAPTMEFRQPPLYAAPGYEFFLDFYFDKISAVYLLVGALLTFMVAIYSRVYMHRESGYKRYFSTILFFYFGYNLVVLSGNLETLFVGWEILGISSFLLIAFYRERFLPVRNAIKVYSIYRLGDVGLLIALWMSHQLWHENITFMKLEDSASVNEHLQSHSMTGIIISLMILLAAAGKSAQLPFSSWLPRAMEGPTPSTAIFYGSLSVHLGVFMLLRTFPFWENQFSIRFVIGGLGLFTSLLASGTARVQSSVKSQIAYASIAQIGLIFMEVAAGFENLALLHFAGNAFLRTYQLLVSPSVVTFLIREQSYASAEEPSWLKFRFPGKLKNSIFLLSLKEWNLDGFIYKIYWGPIKRAGRILWFVNFKTVFYLFLPVYMLGMLFLWYGDWIPQQVHSWFPTVFAGIGLLMVMRSFTKRKDVLLAWALVVFNHFWIALAVLHNEQFRFDQVALYLGGIFFAGVFGFVCLLKLKRMERGVDTSKYQGHAWEHPKLAALFFLACLGLTGFPITTSFIGEDLIFSHIHQDQFVLAVFTSLSFVIDGLAVMRIYSKLFMGPHIKSYHDLPLRSS